MWYSDALLEEREPVDWEEQETGFSELWAELGRLKRRAQARKWLTLLITVALTTFLVVREMRKVRAYPAKIILSIEEKVIDEDVPPTTNGQFQEYVANAVFSDQRLLEIIQKYETHPIWKKDPKFAVESFREDLEVAAYRNTFLLYAYGRGDTREARLSVEYWFRDPDVALKIVRDLGQLIITHEAERRAAKLKLTSIRDDMAREQAEAEVSRLERRIAELEQLKKQLGIDRPASLLIDERNAKKALKSAKQDLDQVRIEQRSVSLVGAAEQATGTVQFNVADWGTAAKPTPKEQRAAILAFILFFALLPIVALAVGAFDTRVYYPEDVARLGLSHLGQVRIVPLPTHLSNPSPAPASAEAPATNPPSS